MTRKPRVRVESKRAVVVSAVDKAMRSKVRLMQDAVHKKLQLEVLVGERTGNWYKVPKTNRMYRASAPGEAPARRTGDLARSYKKGKLEVEAGRVQGKVGTALDYPAFLEGPMNRPHLEPAVELAKPEISQILRGDWGIE